MEQSLELPLRIGAPVGWSGCLPSSSNCCGKPIRFVEDTFYRLVGPTWRN